MRSVWKCMMPSRHKTALVKYSYAKHGTIMSKKYIGYAGQIAIVLVSLYLLYTAERTPGTPLEGRVCEYTINKIDLAIGCCYHKSLQHHG